MFDGIKFKPEMDLGFHDKEGHVALSLKPTPL